jgi:hypothetical protein
MVVQSRSHAGGRIRFTCSRDATQHRWLEQASEKEVVDFYAILTTGTFAQMEAACEKILLKYDPESVF